MNLDNLFDLLVDIVFVMIPQIGGIWPKAQDLVIYFHLSKGETLLKYHLRYLQAKSENFLLNDKTEQKKNLAGKYIMELSKLKNLQCYTTKFELEYRNSKQNS